jgi:hypothetical protein
MRTVYLSLILCLISTLGYNQARKTDVSHYLFPEFKKGNVVMHSGIKNVTMLNYNAVTEEMIFEANGKKLAVSKLDEIEAIYIEERKFIPFHNKFVEIIYQNIYELYAAHKCSVTEPGKPAAYGGTSQTSASTSYSSISSGGQVYELSLPQGIETKPYTEYWIRKDDEVSSFLNMRQLSKNFSDKSDIFKKYVKEHKVTYENQESLIGLIKYMEQQ